MEDLHRAKNQYLTCANPTEVAARRQRVLDGDVRGDTEATAARIIAAAYQSQTQALLPVPQQDVRHESSERTEETPFHSFVNISPIIPQRYQNDRESTPKMEEEPPERVTEQTTERTRKLNSRVISLHG